MQGRSVESVPQDVPFQTGSRVTAGSAPTAALTPGRGEQGSIRGERGSVQGRCGAGAVAAAGRAVCGGRLRRAGTCAASALRGAAAGLCPWARGCWRPCQPRRWYFNNAVLVGHTAKAEL